MSKSEIINSTELIKVIDIAIQGMLPCVLCYMSKGKWNKAQVQITSLSRKSLTLFLAQNEHSASDICIEQPIGITFEADQAKYLFESKVIGLDTGISDGNSGNILISRPISIEKMQRRSYTRVTVPPQMRVNALFWHRGYTDDTVESPLDNYWQGRMTDLSAGGAQVKVTREQIDNFKHGQIVGMQFTPLPYEKPLLIEGQIKHIAPDTDDEGMISLGIEFLGLEANVDGRTKLERIINTVNVYQTYAPEIERSEVSVTELNHC